MTCVLYSYYEAAAYGSQRMIAILRTDFLDTRSNRLPRWQKIWYYVGTLLRAFIRTFYFIFVSDPIIYLIQFEIRKKIIRTCVARKIAPSIVSLFLYRGQTINYSPKRIAELIVSRSAYRCVLCLFEFIYSFAKKGVALWQQRPATMRAEMSS